MKPYATKLSDNSYTVLYLGDESSRRLVYANSQEQAIERFGNRMRVEWKFYEENVDLLGLTKPSLERVPV